MARLQPSMEGESRDGCLAAGIALALTNRHGTEEAESRAWQKRWWKLVICRRRSAE